MPFNPGGVYSLIASYFAQPGTTIRTEQHNPVFEDVASALSLVLLRDGRAPMTGPLNMNGNPINNIAPGSSPGSVATLAQAMPIGGVIDYAGATPPAGWLFCYGQEISRTTYADLFAVLGTAFGAGNGSTTFNLPDCRGRVVAGRDGMGGTLAGRLSGFTGGVDGAALGNAGGNQYHALTISQLPSASLSVNIPSGQGTHNHAVTGGTYGGTTSRLWSQNDTDGPASSAKIVISDASLPAMSGSASFPGGNAAHNNVQPTLIMNKIIRVSYNG